MIHPAPSTANISTASYIGITDNRLLHMRAVGRVCHMLARDVFGWDEARCRQMFVLG